MLTTKPEVVDRSRDMDERSWWDLWNTSHRSKDDNDPVSSELFARAAAAVNRVTRKRDCRVLEVGCGTGTLSRMLEYSSYHGLDLSPAAIEIARQKSGRRSPLAPANSPTYEAADFHDWPLPAHPFDLVVCVDAIYLFRDQALAMGKIAQCVRPDGQVVITAINRFVYDRIQRTPSVRLESGPAAHWLTRGELHALVRQAGLVIEHSSTAMPRGNLGILRWVNSRRLNEAFGPRMAAIFRRLKELMGLGQYSIVIARKKG